MNFIKVREAWEILKEDKYVPVESDININIDNISFIRETPEGLNVFLIGRDKAVNIINKDDVELIKKECKLKQKSLKE